MPLRDRSCFQFKRITAAEAQAKSLEVAFEKAQKAPAAEPAAASPVTDWFREQIRSSLSMGPRSISVDAPAPAVHSAPLPTKASAAPMVTAEGPAAAAEAHETTLAAVEPVAAPPEAAHSVRARANRKAALQRSTKADGSDDKPVVAAAAAAPARMLAAEAAAAPAAAAHSAPPKQKKQTPAPESLSQEFVPARFLAKVGSALLVASVGICVLAKCK